MKEKLEKKKMAKGIYPEKQISTNIDSYIFFSIVVYKYQVLLLDLEQYLDSKGDIMRILY